VRAKEVTNEHIKTLLLFIWAISCQSNSIDSQSSTPFPGSFTPITFNMAEYTLQIKIDQDHVKHFNTSGYKLCVASGVETGGTLNFNVVAYSTRE
jgi:hypothetical protein